MAICSPTILIGVFVLVNVAFEAKGVNVEVPPVYLLTIFVLELHAAHDHKIRTKVISIKKRRLCMIRYLTQPQAIIVLEVRFDCSFHGYQVVIHFVQEKDAIRRAFSIISRECWLL